MIASNSLRSFTAVLAVLLLLPVEGLTAKNKAKKANEYIAMALTAEEHNDWDKALEYYTLALADDPSNSIALVGMRHARFEAGQGHVELGLKLRQAGKLEEALVEFQKAFSIDPASAIAVQEIKNTTDALELERSGKLPPAEAKLTSGERAQKETEQRLESMLPEPELKPINNQPIVLKMNNQPPRVLYETVGKLAGINVVFDPQYQPTGKNVNLDLSNTTLEEALNYIALLTKTYWKPITSNAIFVTEDSVTKRRDYEDQIVKVFYLKNPTTPQEFQEIVQAVRSVTDIRRMFTYAPQNAVVVRGTVDQVELAEKLFHDLDKPKSEVVIDIMVIELNDNYSRSLAAGILQNGTSTPGLSLPIAYTPRSTISLPSSSTGTTGTGTGTTGTTTTTTTTSSIPLSAIGKTNFDDFSTALPGAELQAILSDTTTKTLNSPQVRASDGQKVSLKIGDKIPYATGSFQPGVGTVGVSPLVSTQFQYADTGVNIEITPHVHRDGELTMHILVDISNANNSVTIGGLQQPIISQRKNEGDIRLRDGEISLVGGLMQTQDSNVVNGIPGLVNIPIIGKFLFGGVTKTKMTEQLLIALIPHIVRTPNLTELDMRGVAAGTEQEIKLSFAPKEEPAAPTPPAAPTSTAPVSQPPTPTPPPAPAPAPATPATPPPTAPAPAAAPTGPPGLTFATPTPQAPIGGPVALALRANDVTDLFTAPIHLKWDPKILRLERVTPGALFSQDGQKPNAPVIDIRNDTGEASVGISRNAGGPGVTGSGTLVLFTFTAIAKGTTTIEVTQASLENSKQKPIQVARPNVTISVQ